MSTQRITITLPDRLAAELRKRARAARKPVSRLVAEALREQEEARIRELMIRGYIESRDESKRLAEEWLPLSTENWPEE